MSEDFSSSVLRVEQPRRGPFARSRYKVMDGDGTLLASADELGQRATAEKLQTYFPGKSDIHARAVLLESPDGTPLFVVDKKEGRELTLVSRPDGEAVGSFKTERIGRRYAILDGEDKALGAVNADVSRQDFTVQDADGETVAKVRKKFAGLVTHLLTTADKYAVQIHDPVPEPLRTMVVMTAIAMDLTLHESKDIT